MGRPSALCAQAGAHNVASAGASAHRFNIRRPALWCLSMRVAGMLKPTNCHGTHKGLLRVMPSSLCEPYRGHLQWGLPGLCQAADLQAHQGDWVESGSGA